VVIRPAAEADVGLFCDMSRRAHPGEPVCDATFVRWKHLESPAGTSTLVSLAGPDGDERGRIWSMPRTWRHRGRLIDARNPVDLVVEEEHRSLPVLISLLRRAITDDDLSGEVVFHTSNPTTGFIYERMMRMQPMVELDAAVWPVNPLTCAQVARGKTPSRLVRMIDGILRTAIRPLASLAGRRVVLAREADPAQKAAVVAAFHAGQRLAHDRSPEWLEWRLRGPSTSPAGEYALRWVLRDDRVVGWVGTADRVVDGLSIRFVLDVALPGARRPTIRATWWRVIARACSGQADILVFFGNLEGNDDQRRLRGWPLIAISRDRVPQRVPLFVHGDGVAADDVRTGYWTLSDFDMV
jgi:hypothetical protein